MDTKSGSVFHTSCAASISELKHTCIAPLDTIESFEVSDSVAFVPPLSQKVLSTNEVKSLEVIYAQLYLSKQVEFISHFYLHASKSVIAEELFGSVCSCSKKASVIGAYWPSKGSSSTTDYTKLQIGVIQYFAKHTVVLKMMVKIAKSCATSCAI